jgi:hypothetical protein
LDAANDWLAHLDTCLKEQELNDNNHSDDDQRNDLAVLERLYREGQMLGFQSKGLVILESKMQKAYQLRERIVN